MRRYEIITGFFFFYISFGSSLARQSHYGGVMKRVFITYFTALFDLRKEYYAISQPERTLHLYLYTIQCKLDNVPQNIEFIYSVLVH